MVNIMSHSTPCHVGAEDPVYFSPVETGVPSPSDVEKRRESHVWIRPPAKGAQTTRPTRIVRPSAVLYTTRHNTYMHTSSSTGVRAFST